MKIKLLTTIILALIIIPSIALALPPVPTKWWGIVSINGSLAAEGVPVRAYVNDTEIATTSVVNGSLYAIDVPCLLGDNVVLRVYDILTTGELACSPGDPFELNLTDCTTPCSIHEICNVTVDTCYSAPQCSDGTYYNECSTNKPKYCDDGNLVDRCDICGCPSGQDCGSDNTCFTPSGPSGPSGGGGGFFGGGGGLPPEEEEEEETPTEGGVPPKEEPEEIPEEEEEEVVEEIIEEEEPEEIPTAPTGFFLELTTTEWASGIVVGIIAAALIIFLLTRKRKKRR